MKKKIICFDIDGVICRTVGLDYHKSKPILKNIKKINELYNRGYYIKLFTARYMGQLKNNISAVTNKNNRVTKAQIKKWGVKHHQLLYGKPVYSLFIDDKNLFHKKNWGQLIENEIKKI
jgi:hypothetical protein